LAPAFGANEGGKCGKRICFLYFKLSERKNQGRKVALLILLQVFSFLGLHAVGGVKEVELLALPGFPSLAHIR